MKSTILLTTALFLASAPAPDTQAISEFSAGFLVFKNDFALMTSGDELQSFRGTKASAHLAELLAQEVYELKNQKDG